jgi:hypothetical protein
MKNKFYILKTITFILPVALLLVSCSSNRLPFIITAQYADRPILIGQYKRPGEKIDPAAKGIPFESKQGTDDLGNQSNSSSCCLSLSNQNNDTGMNLNKLSRDILMTNCKKSDIIVVQEINIGSSTYQIFSVGITLTNKSILKGKILEEAEE